MQSREEQAELLDEVNAIEASVCAAVREALLQHKRAGNSIAAWKDGMVQWISADDIDLTVFDVALINSAENGK